SFLFCWSTWLLAWLRWVWCWLWCGWRGTGGARPTRSPRPPRGCACGGAAAGSPGGLPGRGEAFPVPGGGSGGLRAACAWPAPVEHRGVEDDESTSEWLHDVATVPTDPWEAVLAEFGQTWEVELAAHDERFWDAIGPEWTELVRGDKTTTGEMWRIVEGSFE